MPLARQRLAGEEPGEVAEVAVVVPRGIGFALRLAPRARVRARSKRGFWNTCIPVYVINRARPREGLLITFPGRLSGSAEVLPDMSYYISDTMSINSDPCAPTNEWGSGILSALN